MKYNTAMKRMAIQKIAVWNTFYKLKNQIKYMLLCMPNDRGWDGCMASPTWWTWVWVNSGSLWWTGRHVVLRFMGSQRVGHNWATELNWTEGFNRLIQKGKQTKGKHKVWTTVSLAWTNHEIVSLATDSDDSNEPKVCLNSDKKRTPGSWPLTTICNRHLYPLVGHLHIFSGEKEKQM